MAALTANRDELLRKLHRLHVVTDDIRRRGKAICDPFEKENILRQKTKKRISLKKQNDELEKLLESTKARERKNAVQMTAPQRSRSRMKEDVQGQLRYVQGEFQAVQTELRDAEKKLREEEMFAEKTAKLVHKKSFSPSSPQMSQDNLRMLEKHKQMLAQSLIVIEKRFMAQKKELDRMICSRREKLDEVKKDAESKEDIIKNLTRKIAQKEGKKTGCDPDFQAEASWKESSMKKAKLKPTSTDDDSAVHGADLLNFHPSTDEISAEIRALRQRMKQ